MSKRTRDEATQGGSDQPQKKRKPFSAGPANLPEGTYKRKTQKIKDDLIKKAKVKKAYAKIKAQAEDEVEQSSYDPYRSEEAVLGPTTTEDSKDDGKSLELHPARMAMLEEPEPEPEPERQDRRRGKRRDQRGGKSGDDEDVNGFNSRGRNKKERPRGTGDLDKPVRYTKEFAKAEERMKQIDTQQKAREERDKDRRAMAKARKTGKDGKMKLGRQGTVLLGRVQRLKNEGRI